MRAELKLPRPPTANNLYANVWNSRSGRIKTKQYKAWIIHAGLVLNKQFPPKFKGRVAVTYYIPALDRRRRDIFNMEKPISDLLSMMDVITDDKMIDDGRVVRVDIGEGYKKDEVYLEIRDMPDRELF